MGARQVLLVEGINDVHVFCNLFERHAIPETFQVKNKEGVSKLLDELDVELLASELTTLGIVVDADIHIEGRWQALLARLENCGYQNLPAAPDANGTVIPQAGLPTIGIWLMPDNRLSGTLEDFIAYLIPAGDAFWDYAKQVVAAIEPEKRLFKSHVAKANIHTWLAWQEQPGAPMGSAIKMRYLDSDAAHALAFTKWIKKLFLN